MMTGLLMEKIENNHIPSVEFETEITKCTMEIMLNWCQDNNAPNIRADEAASCRFEQAWNN
jgi:hypothetical protein